MDKNNNYIMDEFNGYETSRDYEKLWRLAQEQRVICIVDCDGDGRDIAHTTRRTDWVSVSAKGISYVDSNSLEDFVKECSAVSLEFIEPMPPCVEEMLARPGLWAVWDPNYPQALAPVASKGGQLYSMKIDEKLDPRSFNSGVRILGPIKPCPDKSHSD